MPSLGAGMDVGKIVEWCVTPGDEVHRGDIIAVVETDKAAIEVEVFEDGVVDELLVDEGTKVPVGTALATLRPAGAPAPTSDTEQPVAEPAAEPVAEPSVEEPVTAPPRLVPAAAAAPSPPTVAPPPHHHHHHHRPRRHLRPHLLPPRPRRAPARSGSRNPWEPAPDGPLPMPAGWRPSRAWTWPR